MGFLKHLIVNPMISAAFGWIIVPFIFMVLSITTMLHVKIEVTFILMAPVLLLGVLCWILAFFTGGFYMFAGPHRKEAFIGFVFSVAPIVIIFLASLAFDFGVGF